MNETNQKGRIILRFKDRFPTTDIVNSAHLPFELLYVGYVAPNKNMVALTQYHEAQST